MCVSNIPQSTNQSLWTAKKQKRKRVILRNFKNNNMMKLITNKSASTKGLGQKLTPSQTNKQEL